MNKRKKCGKHGKERNVVSKEREKHAKVEK